MSIVFKRTIAMSETDFLRLERKVMEVGNIVSYVSSEDLFVINREDEHIGTYIPTKNTLYCDNCVDLLIPKESNRLRIKSYCQ